MVFPRFQYCLDCYCKTASQRMKNEGPCPRCHRTPREAMALRMAFTKDNADKPNGSDDSLTASSSPRPRRHLATDLDSEASPKSMFRILWLVTAGMGERSKSFNPDACLKKPARTSISQAPRVGRQSRSISSVAEGKGIDTEKAIFSRKFLSLKTLRIQGLPVYALNHVRSFEWMGKYGPIVTAIVVDKSPMCTIVDTEFETQESARLCILDAHGSVIRTGGPSIEEFRIRVSPCVVHFCPQYLHGIGCHNPRCMDLHSGEAFDWIRSLPTNVTAKQIGEMKKDIVRDIRAHWRDHVGAKPKLLGEAEQATIAKIKQHDFAAEILTLSVTLADIYANEQSPAR